MRLTVGMMRRQAMRLIVALVLISLTASMATAAAAERIYSARETRFLAIGSVDEGSLEFTLSIGVSDGEAQCIEGDVSCLTVSGEATKRGSVFIYSGDDGEIMFEINADSVEISEASGDLGSGSGNARQLSRIVGSYRLVAQQQSDAAAQRNDAYFQTPTGNISCVIVSEQGGFVRCDMKQLKQSYTKRPVDCELDWGSAFGIAADGKSGKVICHGDTLFGTEPRKLEYGKTLEVGGFQCLSEKTGLTCKNSAGHGFTLSRARQKVF